MGGGFPGLAVFSLIALLAMLVGLALLSLRPWEPDSVGPQVRVSPGIGTGLDDSVIVAPVRRLDVAAAQVAGGGHATPAGEPVAIPDRDSVPELGISQRRPVSRPELATVPARPPESESPPPSSPQPASPPPALVSAPPSVPTVVPAPPAPQLIADFENGLQGWSTVAGVDFLPRVVTGTARDGSRSGVARLTGDQSRSQLVLGGDGRGSGVGAVQIREGDAYAFAFSFYIQTMVYGEPGDDNLIMQLKGDASDSPGLGLQLWEFAGDGGEEDRGLWASGEAAGGDRFLAPVSERAWHDAIVYFEASSQEAGFYEVYLDGRLVDARSGVSIIASGSSYAQIEVGLFRDGDRVQGTSEVRIDAAKLGESLESVLP